MGILSRHKTKILDRKVYEKGKVIIHQGDKDATAFLLQSGRVQIYSETKSGTRVDLGIINTGEIFGEMALLFDGPRSASAIALESCTIIPITRTIFEEKIQKSDPTIRAMLKMLTRRLADNNDLVLKISNQDE